MSSGVNPVFVKTKDIPDSANIRPTVLEMCLAAERGAGRGSVVGAQQIHGLWRIYPATQEARTQLLIQGMRVRGVMLQLANTNPFILRSDSGEEKPSTKVWIDNVPISVADSEIEHSLVKAGCELRSTIKAERARDADNKLTRFLTGRRFVFITVPHVPLEKTLKVSLFTANIYHREQKQVNKKPVICSKCLEQNHHASVCDKEIVCRECRQSGHKRGDAACKFAVLVPPGQDMECASGEGQAAESGCEAEDTIIVGQDKQLRGRPGERQATLSSSLQLQNPLRRRSETPKRRRSKEATSPKEVKGKGKYAKRDSGRSDRHAPQVSDTEEGDTCG